MLLGESQQQIVEPLLGLVDPRCGIAARTARGAGHDSKGAACDQRLLALQLPLQFLATPGRDAEIALRPCRAEPSRSADA